jgi:hypothetical protein
MSTSYIFHISGNSRDVVSVGAAKRLESGCDVNDIQLRRRGYEEQPSPSDLVAFQSPKARVMLAVAGLLSLGLWAAIWAALRSLASALSF